MPNTATRRSYQPAEELASQLLLLRPGANPSPVEHAAAVFVAYFVYEKLPPQPPRVNLHKFFESARTYAADAAVKFQTRDLNIPTRAKMYADPRSSVAAVANAFSVSETVFRKLNDLRQSAADNVVAHFPESIGLRDVWILFLVAKVVTRLDLDPALTSDVHAYHLLLAVITLLTHSQHSETPPAKRQRAAVSSSPSSPTSLSMSNFSPSVVDLCAATGAVPSEVFQFLAKFRQALPAEILSVLPFENPHDTDELRIVSAAVEKHYQCLLDQSNSSIRIDERVFVDAPHLVISPSKSRHLLLPDVNMRVSGADLPSDSPHPIKIDQNIAVSIPESRQIAFHPITVTRASPYSNAKSSPTRGTSTAAASLSPSRTTCAVSDARSFAKFVHDDPRPFASRSPAERVDALDALAAVASSTPRSPAVQPVSADLDAAASSSVLRGLTPITKHGLHKLQTRHNQTPVSHSLLIAATPPPSTPTTTALASVKWLQGLVQSRPETSFTVAHSADVPASSSENPVSGSRDLCDEHALSTSDLALFSSQESEVPTTECLQTILSDFPGIWSDIVRRIRALCALFDEEKCSFPGPQFLREGCAVFFAALESVVSFEEKRLGKARNRISAVLRSDAFHKSMLTCSLESVSAAYGHRRMRVIPVAVELFKLPPFELSKCIEPFVRRLAFLPLNVRRHIAICEIRLLESIVWLPGSPLVTAMEMRSKIQSPSAKDTANPTRESTSGLRASNSSAERTALDKVAERAAFDGSSNDPEPPAERQRLGQSGTTPSKASGSIPGRPVSVPETALELFFVKFLAIAADRMHELLKLLGLETLAPDVGNVVKHCCWDKWHLMVGRHVDQIIMCSIYGTAKVRQIPLTFKDIIKHYRVMSHVCEPSFQDLVPGTYSAVNLAAGSCSSPKTESSPQRRMSGLQSSGDIIKFYNQVYIHATKGFLLKFQPGADMDKKSNSCSEQQTPKSKSATEVGRETSRSANEKRRRLDAGSDDSASPSTGATESAEALVGKKGEDVSNEDKSVDRCSKKDSPQDAHEATALFDRVEAAVLKSPMRATRRPHASRRIGFITVSPMSQRSRLSTSTLQSPQRRLNAGNTASMTPATRTLYAFGESPSRDLDRINRKLRSPLYGASSADTTPLQFDTSDPTGGIRRKQGDLLKQRGILRRKDSPP